MDFAMPPHTDSLQDFACGGGQNDDGDQHPLHDGSSESRSLTVWDVVLGAVRPTIVTPTMISAIPAQRARDTCSSRANLPTRDTITQSMDVTGSTYLTSAQLCNALCQSTQ